MKTRAVLQSTILVALLIMLGAQVRANTIVSDTLTITTTDSLFLRNFGPVSPGQSECHTIYLKNTSSEVVIINSASTTRDDIFSVKSIPTLPVILLQGEMVSLAELCYKASNPTELTSTAYFRVVCMVGSNSRGIMAPVSGSQTQIDSLLFKPCISIASYDNSVFGPIIMDGDVIRQVTLKSNRHEAITISSFYSVAGNNKDDFPSFKATGITFPYSLAPLETKTFNVVYSPRSNVPTVEYRVYGFVGLNIQGGCTYWRDTVIGIAIPPTADSISTALNAGSTDVLAMLGDNSVTTKTFHFTNTGTTNLKITAVSLKNGKSFAITDIQPTTTLPFVLTPGQSMSVTIAMTTTSNGVYYDEVLITAENALISMEFQLQGLRTGGVASVRTASSSQRITIYPNPTQGMIFAEFPGIRNAKVTVLDLLGNVATTATASEKWSWNATVPTGTYLLQLSGVDESGKPVQSNERFIIAK